VFTLAQSIVDSAMGNLHWWAAPMAALFSMGVTFYLGHVLSRRYRSASTAFGLEGDFFNWDPFVHGSVAEERATPRRKGNPIAVHLSDATASASPIEGWVVDRSQGGLGLSVFNPIRPGTLMTVRPVSAPVGTPWFEIWVRSCRWQDKNWHIGCEFKNPPTWNMLLLFG
jgi:hypothetical protein